MEDKKMLSGILKTQIEQIKGDQINLQIVLAEKQIELSELENKKSAAEEFINNYCGFATRQDLVENDIFKYGDMQVAFDSGQKYGADKEREKYYPLDVPEEKPEIIGKVASISHSSSGCGVVKLYLDQPNTGIEPDKKYKLTPID